MTAAEYITKDQFEKLGISEVCSLGGEDGIFYSSVFFPRACKTRSPDFHRMVWNELEAGGRYCAIEVFRDGAKTTLLRLFASKRIAYGVSRTIVVVGKGQDHAIKTIRWLKKAVEFNKKWSNAFHLEKGGKWTDEWIEIVHRGFEEDGEPVTINVVAYGITGQIRGVNIDDFRPDLIIVDDPCDEENTGSPEQRKKISELFFGALKNCLVPQSENPSAMMVLLQTSLHKEDIINMCHLDPEWHSMKISVFDAKGNSVWEERWPTAQLKKEKEGYIRRNQLSLWLREKECKLTSPETSAFLASWLGFYDELPEDMTVVIAIDPVPPPTDRSIAQGLTKKDFEVILAMGLYKKKFYLLGYQMNRGHDPEWTLANFFGMALYYKPIRVVVETTQYQSTLKWLLEKAMHSRREYYVVEGFDDKVQKYHLITQAFSDAAMERNILCAPHHVEFIEQWNEYPACSYDDVLNAAAMAKKKLEQLGDIFSFRSLEAEEHDVEPISFFRHAP